MSGCVFSFSGRSAFTFERSYSCEGLCELIELFSFRWKGGKGQETGANPLVRSHGTRRALNFRFLHSCFVSFAPIASLRQALSWFALISRTVRRRGEPFDFFSFHLLLFSFSFVLSSLSLSPRLDMMSRCSNTLPDTER